MRGKRKWCRRFRLVVQREVKHGKYVSVPNGDRRRTTSTNSRIDVVFVAKVIDIAAHGLNNVINKHTPLISSLREHVTTV